MVLWRRKFEIEGKKLSKGSFMNKILEDQEVPEFDKANFISKGKLAFLRGVFMEGGSETEIEQYLFLI